MFPERLTNGYRTFLNGRFASERVRYQELAASGQSPSIMVVGCVDSRVSPEVIFDAAPGELLVARNVANLVPRYEPEGETQHGTSAALEFAVRALKVSHIVVLGHAFCGGIKAFAKENCLLEQQYIHDTTKTVAQAMKEAESRAGAPIKVTKFVRYALGEGIEKQESDFAAEVAATSGVSQPPKDQPPTQH